MDMLDSVLTICEISWELRKKIIYKSVLKEGKERQKNKIAALFSHHIHPCGACTAGRGSCGDVLM
jgi:hypothetical protein